MRNRYLWDGMGWDGMSWDGVAACPFFVIGWGGTGWRGTGWRGTGRDLRRPPLLLRDGMGWDGMGWDGMGWGVCPPLLLLRDQPLLDQILVEGVAQRAKRDLARVPTARGGVHEDGVQPVGLVGGVHPPHDVVRHVPVLSLPRVVREVLELELDRAELGEDGRALRRFPWGGGGAVSWGGLMGRSHGAVASGGVVGRLPQGGLMGRPHGAVSWGGLLGPASWGCLVERSRGAASMGRSHGAVSWGGLMGRWRRAVSWGRLPQGDLMERSRGAAP